MRGAAPGAGSWPGIMDITILNDDAGHLSVRGLKRHTMLGGIATLKAVDREVGNACMNYNDAISLRASPSNHRECACTIVTQRYLMTGTPMHMVQIKFFVPHITPLKEDCVIWMQTGQHALRMADRAPGCVGCRASIGIRAGGTATASVGIVHVIHCAFYCVLPNLLRS